MKAVRIEPQPKSYESTLATKHLHLHTTNISNRSYMHTLYRVVQKTAQSLWHHNFATVHHRVIRFLA